MMTRIKVVAAVSFALLCMTVLAILGYDNDRGWTLTRSTLDKIKPGMTLNEVEAILGPGEESQVLIVPPIQGENIYEWNEWQKDWKPDGLTTPARRSIYIGFRDGKVCDKHYFEPSL